MVETDIIVIMSVHSKHAFKITPIHTSSDLEPEDSEYYYMPLDQYTHKETNIITNFVP